MKQLSKYQQLMPFSTIETERKNNNFLFLQQNCCNQNFGKCSQIPCLEMENETKLFRVGIEDFMV